MSNFMNNQHQLNKNVVLYVSEQLDTDRLYARTVKNIPLNFEQEPNQDNTQEKQNESSPFLNEFEDMEYQRHYYDVSSFNQVFSLHQNNSEDPELLFPEQPKAAVYNDFLNGCSNLYLPLQENQLNYDETLNHLQPTSHPQWLGEVQFPVMQTQSPNFEKKFLDFQENDYNFQQDLTNQQFHQVGGQNWQQIHRETAEGASSGSQKSNLPEKIRKTRKRNKPIKDKHRLDGKLVNKLKNFYRNIMGRIRGAFLPLYEHNTRMIQLIDSLCLESNQRNFLKLFPQLKEESSYENKEMGIDLDQEDFSNNNEDRELLNELRKQAKSFFGKYFLRMVSLFKSKNSQQNKEEFLYGCLFYAERSDKKSPLFTSENAAIQKTKFNFQFQQTVFSNEILSADEQISGCDSDVAHLQSLNYSLNLYHCDQPSMSPQYSQNLDSPMTYQQNNNNSIFEHQQ